MQKIRSTLGAKRSEAFARRRSVGVANRSRAITATILFSIGALALFTGRGASAIADEFTVGSLLDFVYGGRFIPAEDYSRFFHTSPKEHQDLAWDSGGRPTCDSCHRRSDSSPTPRFPVHKDCTGCHLVQFTAATSGDNPICMICHTKEGINLSKPPLKNFSGLRSFNAQFDHAQHLQGIESARPPKGCGDCHASASGGVAETIPARLDAHGGCYKCHSPGGQASNFSSCGSCHKSGRYSPTPTAARAYRVSFSHAEHGPRQRLSCESCHTVIGRNLPQARQVSSILTAQHRSNVRARGCMTCHNGQRVFGDKGPNFDDCKRCHKGTIFRT